MAQREAERAKLNAPTKTREVKKSEFVGLTETQEETWEDTWASKKTKAAATTEKEQRATSKSVMPIVFKFVENPRPDDDRGDRGGRGGRGGDRADRPPRKEGDRADRPPRKEGGGRGDRREGGRGAGRGEARGGRGTSGGRGGGRGASFNIEQDFPTL